MKKSSAYTEPDGIFIVTWDSSSLDPDINHRQTILFVCISILIFQLSPNSSKRYLLLGFFNTQDSFANKRVAENIYGRKNNESAI
jgi:hypothetical protein